MTDSTGDALGNLDLAPSERLEAGRGERRWSAPWPRLGAVAAVVAVFGAGWFLGRGATPVTASPTMRLSIDTITTNAAIAVGSTVVVRLDGFLVVADLPQGSAVRSITWGDLSNRVTGDGTVIPVAIETYVDCRVARGPGVSFPALVADVDRPDGVQLQIPVQPLSAQRWADVEESCADAMKPTSTMAP